MGVAEDLSKIDYCEDENATDLNKNEVSQSGIVWKNTGISLNRESDVDFSCLDFYEQQIVKKQLKMMDSDIDAGIAKRKDLNRNEIFALKFYLMKEIVEDLFAGRTYEVIKQGINVRIVVILIELQKGMLQNPARF
ncbi:hypothetical protein GF340_00680 [Candidatus Peregrinibacteria bacterium]|nr:hypothetical protein [Candidatus Peregrinibacteria bacterium]